MRKVARIRQQSLVVGRIWISNEENKPLRSNRVQARVPVAIGTEGKDGGVVVLSAGLIGVDQRRGKGKGATGCVGDAGRQCAAWTCRKRRMQRRG